MENVTHTATRLAEYDALIAKNAEPYDSAGMARLAQAQQMQAANDSANIAQAFDEAAMYMGVFETCTSQDIQDYLINCGFECHIVKFIMAAFDDHLQGGAA